MEPGPKKAVDVPPPGALLGRWRLPFFYGWVIVAVVFLSSSIASGMGTQVIGLFFKPMSEELGWSLTMLVGAVTAQAIAGTVAAPIIGPLLDRFGARPVMAMGALIAGIGLLLLINIQQVWQFWVLYAIVGSLGLSELGQLPGPVVVAKWFVRRRGRAMAFATLGTAVGGMVMGPIIALLIGAVGWRNTWGIMGAVLLLVMVPTVLLFMRRQPEDMGLRPDGDAAESSEVPETANAPAVPRSNLDPKWTMREALSTRTFWLLIIAFNLVGLTLMSVNVNMLPFFTQQEGMSILGASYVLTLRLLGSSLTRIPWGFIVEHIPVRLCLATLFLFRSMGTLSLAVVPYPFNIFTFALFSGLLGGAFSLLQPIAFADYYGRAFLGSIRGVVRPLVSLPQLAGPLLVAMLFDARGSFDLAFQIVSVLGFLGVAVILFATPPIHRTADA